MCRLFQDPDKGGIDFSGNAEVLACMMIYFLISSGAKFGQKYFDLILYGGLLLIAFFLYRHVTGAELTEYGNIILKDTGAAASCFMLVCMVGVYRYCVCKDRLRSIFYPQADSPAGKKGYADVFPVWFHVEQYEPSYGIYADFRDGCFLFAGTQRRFGFAAGCRGNTLFSLLGENSGRS